MAYNARFNPDALPAHAEPEQAAQLLAKPDPTHTTNSTPSPAPHIQQQQQQRQYQNKPQPPLPQTQAGPSYRRQSHPPSYNAGAHPQQPGGYGGPPPQQGYGQPPAGYGGGYQQQGLTAQRIQPVRSPSPARRGGPPIGPAGTTDASLFPLFKAVDTRGVGQLSEEELGKALVNGDFTNFDPQTVRLMIKMFDHDRNGTIGYEEFCGLWGFLGAWRTLFDRFDEDRSGYISFDEYSKALVAFGYNLSTEFVRMLYSMYDRRGGGSMSFDLFVQSCISLKRMTDVFKKYDDDRDGYITLSFEEFLTEIIHQR